MKEKYIEKLKSQCLSYAYKHYYYINDRNDIEIEDVTQEMLQIIWQSYTNQNGITELIENRKLIPPWQLKLVFLNALRNLKLYNTGQPAHYPHNAGTGQVVVDEDGEIIDFYILPDKTTEPDLPLSGNEKEKWLKEIKRLKEIGYSDFQIIQMLQPIAEKLNHNGLVIPEPKQRGLF